MCSVLIGQGWVSKCSLFSVLKTQFPCASPSLLLLGNPTPIPSIYMHHTATRSLRLQAFSQWGVDDLSPEVFPFQMMRFDVRSVSFYNHTLCSRRWSRCPPTLPLVVSLFDTVCRPFSWVYSTLDSAFRLLFWSPHLRMFPICSSFVPSLSSHLRSYLVLFHSSCSKQCR